MVRGRTTQQGRLKSSIFHLVIYLSSQLAVVLVITHVTMVQ